MSRKSGEAQQDDADRSLALHRVFAEALQQTGDKKRAIFELVSAMLCDADPVELAAVRVTFEGLGGKAP